MCNAWNHPPGCTCGWGGEGHLGMPVAPPSRQASSTIYKTLSSFTNPNAKCPVCGASVFFYQSESGGKVFFDSLGIPWPKHPCTDSVRFPASSSSAGLAIKRVSVDPSLSTAGTTSESYKPLLVTLIEIRSEERYSRIWAKTEYREILLYVPEWELEANSPYYYRETGQGGYSIVTIKVDRFNQVQQLFFPAFTALSDLLSYKRQHKPLVVRKAPKHVVKNQ